MAHTLGKVDALVNNAGGARRGDDDETWQAAIDVNLLAAVRASRAAVEHMKVNGGGSVINITSIFGRESGGSPPLPRYKSAITSHAKQLALQLARIGIRVNSVAPGSIRFPGGSWGRRVQEDPEGMAAFVKQNIASGRFGTVEEVANAVVFLCSPAASWITARRSTSTAASRVRTYRLP